MSEDSNSVPDPRAVFVIHGRNILAKEALCAFLRRAGLHVIEWNDAVADTEQTAPHSITILEAALAAAKAVIVLFTGDDIARVHRRYGREPLRAQPRANVIFEAGMAFGKFPNKTVFVQIGFNREFSDLAGLHYIQLDGTQSSSSALLRRLKDAGCVLNDRAFDAPFQYTPALEAGTDRTIEMSKHYLFLAIPLLIVLGLAMATFWHRTYPPLVRLDGEYKGTSSVKIYVVGRPKEVSEGKFSAPFRVPPEDDLNALYVMGDEILKISPVNSSGGTQLPVFSYQIPDEQAIRAVKKTSDEEHNNFLHPN